MFPATQNHSVLPPPFYNPAKMLICPTHQEVTTIRFQWSLVNNITSRLCHLLF